MDIYIYVGRVINIKKAEVCVYRKMERVSVEFVCGRFWVNN